MAVNLAWMTKRPTGGMIPRKRETLKGPLQLARLGHSLRSGRPCSHLENTGSPWWLSEGSMEYLWSLSRNSGTPLSTLVRQRCCIPHYWDSSCDLVYEITLRGYVECWIGPGTFFFPEKSQGETPDVLWPENDVAFFPAGEFPQIFIPGLWDPAVREAAIQSALVVPTAELALASSYVSASRVKLW